jgi:hypothetical protein
VLCVCVCVCVCACVRACVRACVCVVFCACVRFGSRFADFLYTIADSPVLVRLGEMLRTEEFIDSTTTKASVIAVFHMPDRGLTSVLEMRGVFQGADLKTTMHLFHLDYMPKTYQSELFATYGVLFLLLLLVAAVNINYVHTLRREARTRRLPLDRSGVMGVAYDLCQVRTVNPQHSTLHPETYTLNPQP